MMAGMETRGHKILWNAHSPLRPKLSYCALWRISFIARRMKYIVSRWQQIALRRAKMRPFDEKKQEIQVHSFIAPYVSIMYRGHLQKSHSPFTISA